MNRLSLGTRVKATNGDDVYIGTIVQVNDPDQGDFEYYVDNDDGGGSFWPRECLEILPAQ